MNLLGILVVILLTVVSRGSGDELDDARAAALSQHNKYRSLHGTQALCLDPELNSIAQKYAEKLLAGGKGHSGHTGLGENLYAISWSGDCKLIDSNLTSLGGGATDKWYDEIKKYNFDKPGFYSATGHFTQVVWNATTHLGIGIAIKPCVRAFIVGNYRPPGNNIGTKNFEINVPRPSGGGRTHDSLNFFMVELGFALTMTLPIQLVWK